MATGRAGQRLTDSLIAGDGAKCKIPLIERARRIAYLRRVIAELQQSAPGDDLTRWLDNVRDDLMVIPDPKVRDSASALLRGARLAMLQVSPSVTQLLVLRQELIGLVGHLEENDVV
jgi:hypothetical protein